MAHRRELHLCTCQLYCHSGRMVSHATYHRHEDARRMDLLSFDGGQPIEAEQEADTDRNMEVIGPDTQDVVNGFIVDGPSACEGNTNDEATTKDTQGDKSRY
ncbi:hypothetical protein JB92DRAFT_3133420 [Gautieria morchelliformis]|nr:hypothetical protein JB92DRAFT_3133420 [Gautieria morchelliformis]